MASVTYKIGGKYDGKGIKSATKDLQALATVVKGMAVVKVAQQLGKIAQATKGVFVEQNKALTSFNVAVSKSGIELSKLNNLKKQLSHGNFIDDDSLNNAMKLGLQMGLNEEQIEKVMKASTELASAGVMPLDQAVKTLSQSYSGNAGQLGKLLPDVKNLTKEELANGDAVEMIAQKYAGFTDAMANTFSGRDTQWKNSISDLQASIGAIPQSLEFLTQGKLLEPLNKITEWFVNNRNSILNFFLNMPSIFKTIGIELTNMLKRTFENFPSWISNVGIFFVQMFKDGFTTIFTIAKETFNGMMTLLDFAIGNPFRSSKAFINTMLNNLIEGINGLANKLPNWAKKLIGADDGNAIEFRFDTKSADANKTWNETAQRIEKSMTNVITAYKDGAKKTKDDWLRILDASTNFYADDIDAMKEKLSAILGKDLPEELQMALDGVTFTPASTTSGNEGIGTSASGSSALSGSKEVGTTALNGIGEIGSIVQSVMQNGLWGAIAQLLSKILARVEEVSPIFSYFQNILSELLDVLINPESGLIKAIENAIQPFLDGFNAVKDILGGILNFIAGIINSLTPMLQGFTMILNKIAPVITSILEVLAMLFNFVGIIGEMLNPILEVVLDVIAPILEVINIVIKAVYKVIATIINIIIDIYNAISWGRDKSHISTELGGTSVTKGYDTYAPDLSGYATASASATSGSASYQSAKDIYLNIIFDRSFVNGDGREMALMIRDEIRSAERLGY